MKNSTLSGIIRLWEISIEIIKLTKDGTFVSRDLAKEAPTDVRCTKQRAVDAETNVKCRLYQAVIGLFSVASVLKIMEVRIYGDLAERIPEDLILPIDECTKQYAINAETVVIFRFSREAENQSTAVSVLGVKMIEAAGILNNIRNNLQR